MQAACESEHIPIDEVLEESGLGDDAVFYLICLEADVVEVDGEDVLVECVQVLCPHHAGQALIIIRIFPDIPLVKNTTISHRYDQINSIVANSS